MQKVSETEKELLFAVDSPAELTPELISSLFIQGKALRIEWPRQELKSAMIMELADRYFVQIGMEAPVLNYESESAKLPGKTYDEETTKRIVMESYESGYADVWRGQLADEIIQLFRGAVAAIANSNTTRFVEVDGRVGGLIVIANFKTYRGEYKDHLAWVWIDSRLPKATRKIVGASLLHTAAKLARGQLLAGLYVRNMKSYTFLRKAGFESICATFLQP